MALAHQISLVDLSGEEYRQLRDEIDRAADRIVGEADVGANGEEYDFSGGAGGFTQGELVLGIRTFLRKNLEPCRRG